MNLQSPTLDPPCWTLLLLTFRPWQYTLEVIAEKPDLYLDEIQWHLVSHCELYVSQHTIRRSLNHEKWAEKKAPRAQKRPGYGLRVLAPKPRRGGPM